MYSALVLVFFHGKDWRSLRDDDWYGSVGLSVFFFKKKRILYGKCKRKNCKWWVFNLTSTEGFVSVTSTFVEGWNLWFMENETNNKDISSKKKWKWVIGKEKWFRGFFVVLGSLIGLWLLKMLKTCLLIGFLWHESVAKLIFCFV